MLVFNAGVFQNVLSRLRASTDFTKHILTLMTGTALGQVLILLATPALTRLYSPAVFGTFGLFVSVSTILGVVVTGRYENAILLVNKDKDALNIVTLSTMLSGIASILVLLFIIFGGGKVIALISHQEVMEWLFLVPLSLFLTASYSILNYLNIREKCFKGVALANLIRAIVIVFLQVLLGSFHSSLYGLIVSYIIAQFCLSFTLVANVFHNYNLKQISLHEIKRIAKRYKNFPKFSMWGVFANTFSRQSIYILIGMLYYPEILGFFVLPHRLFNTGISLFSSSVSQVYFQKASEEKKQTGGVYKTFNQTVKKMFLIGLIILVLGELFIEPTFYCIFGEKWRLSGVYAVIYLPLFISDLIVSPISITFAIFERQKEEMLWELALFILTLILFCSALMLSFKFKQFLHYFVIFSSIRYWLLFLRIKHLVAGYSKIQVGKSENAVFSP